MIPTLQRDYYIYNQMFRGNYVKGAVLFRSLIENETTREQLLESVPALSAVFSEFNMSAATRRCYNVLCDTKYFDIAALKYFQGIGATTHTSIEDLLNDTDNMLDIFNTPSIDPIVQENDSLIHRAFQVPSTIKAFTERQQAPLFLTEGKMPLATAAVSGATSKNMYTAFTACNDEIYGTTCDFASSETYYSESAQYEWICINEDTGDAFIPAYLRTRLGTSSDYYYYPAVYRYDYATNTCKLLHVADTSTKYEDSSRYTRAVAYDKFNDHLYMFYRPNPDGNSMLVDIVNGTTGAVLVTALEVGGVGLKTAAYLEPYYCTFDEENGLAKFVWNTGAQNSTNSTYGWLYGCSVNRSGIVWKGIVAKPTTDYGSYSSSYMNVMSNRVRLRYKDGAIVGVHQGSSTVASSYCYMCAIVSHGNKVVPMYYTLPKGTDYSKIYSPTSAHITDDGLCIMHWSSTVWADSTYECILVVDVNYGHTELLLDEQITTSQNYTVYKSPYFNKLCFVSTDDNIYTYVGIDENGKLVTYDKDSLEATFLSTYYQSHGSRRYKVQATSSSAWYVYDYEGGLNR